MIRSLKQIHSVTFVRSLSTIDVCFRVSLKSTPAAVANASEERLRSEGNEATIDGVTKGRAKGCGAFLVTGKKRSYRQGGHGGGTVDAMLRLEYLPVSSVTGHGTQ